jgi:hypothetical protein
MTFLVVLGIYLLALFLLGFFSRRSMGIPALALTAGVVLAKLWTDSLTPIVADAGVIVVRPPLSSIVAVALTLIPAILVMVRAPKVAHHAHAVVSSIVFAVLAVMLTYGAFTNAVVLDAASEQYVAQFIKYDNVIITIAIVIALGEVLFHKKHTSHDRHKK